MQYVCTVLLLIAALITVYMPTFSVAEELNWIRGDGELCSNVCDSKHQDAPRVESSYGKNVYVCRASADRQGKRAGYNMNSMCTIVISEKQMEYSSYECLCVTKGVDH
jgi:hypothetical protein